MPGSSGEKEAVTQTRNLSAVVRGRSLKKSKSLNQRSDSSKKGKATRNSEGKEKLASMLLNLLKPQGQLSKTKAPYKRIDLRGS